MTPIVFIPIPIRGDGLKSRGNYIMERCNLMIETVISAASLQDWLRNGEPVEVIDIRPNADYHSWHIPGSRNVDVYRTLQEGQPGALADYVPMQTAPVVVVCFSGQTSLKAVEYLRARGVPAVSLAGGIEAWSMAWNEADLSLTTGKANVIQVRRTGKGCLSYIVGSDSQALVIDPSLEPQVYIDLANSHGWQIVRVLDTHIHADHWSRARALARITGSVYSLPSQGRATFPYHPLVDGDTIDLGATRLQALHTPGHTLESMSFLLADAILFSGDTLLLHSMGRPDLKAGEHELTARARLLFRSLHKLAGLSPHILLMPGHTDQPVPFDGMPTAAPLATVIAKLDALGYDEAQFVDWIRRRLPPFPANYETIVRLNESGMPPAQDLSSLEAGANRCAI
jgi:glyoxylase-like metal-dependent hydrolase (beta-lactamase superfamily II)/rhodanese-related sulfurtransferase